VRAEELKTTLRAADFTIDLHSTSANCGMVVMIPGGNYDPLAVRLAWTLQQMRADLKVTFSKGTKRSAWCADSVTPSGLSFEVGPVPHGTVDNSLLEELRQLIVQSLDYVDTRNKELLGLEEGRDGVTSSGDGRIVWLPQAGAGAGAGAVTGAVTGGSLAEHIIRQPLPTLLPILVVYEMVQYLRFPEGAAAGSAAAYSIHPSLLGQDWQELTAGTALFVNESTAEVVAFDRKIHLANAGDAEKALYMLFIAEPAYTRNGIALALYERIEKRVY